MEHKIEYYKEITKVKNNNNNFKSILLSFIFGGLLCLFGQVLFEIINNFVNEKDSFMYVSLIMILLSGILTAFGIYDDIASVARMGLAIPITGFSNSAVSSAMEYRSEGVILGVGANTLKLAGSVIVFGTTSAIVVSMIRYFIEVK